MQELILQDPEVAEAIFNESRRRWESLSLLLQKTLFPLLFAKPREAY